MAYGIGSSMHTLSDCGVVDIHTGVEPPKAVEVMKVIVDELVKIRDGITEEELHDARELAKGRMILGMEESRAVGHDLAAQELLRRSIETLDSRIKSLDAVTLEDVQSVALDVVDSGKFVLSTVGPISDWSTLDQVLKF